MTTREKETLFVFVKALTFFTEGFPAIANPQVLFLYFDPDFARAVVVIDVCLFRVPWPFPRLFIWHDPLQKV